MEAVTRLHAAPALLLLAAFALLAVTAGVLAALDRPPAAWLETGRRVLLAVLVAEAALGLVLALRGLAPDEGIHWLYGGAIIVALLVPGTLWTDGPARLRSIVFALSSIAATLFAWRLWGSG